jgi:general secretion pathway protein G
MEIMIVIVIIGLLAGTVTVSVRYYLDRARVNRALLDISVIAKGVESHYGEYGRYPTTAEGLGALKGIEIKKDPWGRPYGYICPAPRRPYDIFCFGADGVDGGEGINADLNLDSTAATAQPDKK